MLETQTEPTKHLTPEERIAKVKAGRSKNARSGKSVANKWMRWTHVYASMIAFVVILFFGATGLLLNHPTWLWGDDVVTTVIDGTLPDSVRNDDGDVEFLAVSEYLRSEHGIVGEVTNFDELLGEGSINYTGPAYGASARFEVSSLDYTVTVTEEGFVNAMRDLHTGSDSGSAWSWVIDISAGFLVLVSLSGLGIQLLMKKRHTRAMMWLAGGAALATALIWISLA